MLHGSRSTLEIQQIHFELNQAYRDEESFWQLKSRNNWLQQGDRNTKFFYAATKNRLDRNRILAIEDDAGNIIRGNREIG